MMGRGRERDRSRTLVYIKERTWEYFNWGVKRRTRGNVRINIVEQKEMEEKEQ